jgi:ribonuclease-3
LERGYGDAAVFIHKYIISKLDSILKSGSWRDAKSNLQEVSQRIDSQTPQYRVIEEEGPDHDKIFTLGVYVDNKLMGKGSGPSKQVAQQQAAQAALDAYKKRSN